MNTNAIDIEKRVAYNSALDGTLADQHCRPQPQILPTMDGGKKKKMSTDIFLLICHRCSHFWALEFQGFGLLLG